MDIVFKCPHCQTELEVDSEASGETIQCPACSRDIVVPAANAPEVRATPPPPPKPAPVSPPAPATPEDSRKFKVPVSDKPVAPLIRKALPTLETQARQDGKKLLHIKTIRHSDCKEVGHDKFDEVVTEFLNRIGEENIISITPINYSYVEMGTQKLITDFGVAVIYRG